MGERIPAEGGFTDASLSLAAVGTPPGTGGPLVLRLDAGAPIQLPPPNETGVPAVTVATVPLPEIQLPQLDLPGSEVVYTVVLPPGVELAFPEGSSTQAVETVTEDGRTAWQFTASGDPNEPAPTVQGAEVVVGHQLVWNLLWPLLLLLFLILVVLPATLIALTIRRRRKRAAAAARASQPDPAGATAPPASRPGEGDGSGARVFTRDR